MKTMHKFTFSAILLLLLVACTAIPSALADITDDVWINGVKLDINTPYWKNDNSTYATEPAGGWNAYFNAATGTLTLNNAAINTPSVFMSAYDLIWADDDLSIVLRGASTISWNNNTYEYVNGIVTSGALAISGDGSVNIQIQSTHPSGSVTAATVYGRLTFVSGTLESTLRAASNAHGLYAFHDVLFAGGQATISAKASGSAGVSAIGYEFRMTGGSLMVRAEGTDPTDLTKVFAVFCSRVSLEGGTGSFTATGLAEQQSGLYYNSDTFSYSGGTFTFAGATSALLNYGDHTSIHYSLGDGLVYASEYLDGSSPIRWKSDADGILTSLLLRSSMSDFKYARFTQPVIQPQTGDRAKTELWAGTALLCLFAVTGLAALRRRRQKAFRRSE